MKSKITISFSCPEKTASLIDDYAARYGVSRSSCITMMCNAFLIADSRTSCSCSDFRISDPHKEVRHNGN